MSNEIKKSAIYKNLVIEIAEDGVVSIKCRSGKTREMLRDISTEVGFEYGSDWNTQFLGHKLVDFINDTDKASKE